MKNLLLQQLNTIFTRNEIKTYHLGKKIPFMYGMFMYISPHPRHVILNYSYNAQVMWLEKNSVN